LKKRLAVEVTTRRPRSRSIAGVLATALVVLLVAGTGRAAAVGTVTALWQMDETSGTTMTDSSGNGNDGTTYNVTMLGDEGYQFNGSSSKVVVPDSETLDPGSSDFSYSVDMRSTVTPLSGTDYDLIRKGIGSTTGGQYKAEVIYAKGQGRALCLVTDSAGVSASIKGITSVTDGVPHTITCTKTSTALTLQVDALAPRTKTVAAGLGSITNTRDLVIGAKTATIKGSAGDWYNGTMQQASVSIG
jgi:hypothetical protein